MTVSAKDLRFNISMLFDVLNKGEEIFITYRGKANAKLISYNNLKEEKSDAIFGLWRDRDENVNSMVRDMRKGN